MLDVVVECSGGRRPCGAQMAKITKKVHKPPRNHYIEWPVFSDIGLNCESQGEKGRTCKKYKILIGSRVFFFHFIHDLPFSPGHLLESEERFEESRAAFNNFASKLRNYFAYLALCCFGISVNFIRTKGETMSD